MDKPQSLSSLFLSIIVVLAQSGTLALGQATDPEHTFEVNSTLDDADANPGDGLCATADPAICTLRAAIMENNELENEDPDAINEILFDIEDGPPVIRPGAPGLPIIRKPVIIDGYERDGVAPNGATPNTLEVGNDAVLMIELDGSNAGDSAHGLILNAGNCTVRGLVINRFARDGIFISGFNTNIIEGNFIGTDLSGTVDRGNGHDGIRILDSGSNQIGGATPEVRNLISGNDNVGVFIGNGPAQGNHIEGNYIGTNAAGTEKLANDLDGVLISAEEGVETYASNNTVGGSEPGQGNLISGNGRIGVKVFRGESNHIMGNLIGTEASGTDKLPNVEDGVMLDEASNNFVGGINNGARNVISGNGGWGVEILAKDRPASNNRVWGNFIGTDKDGLEAVPNTVSGVGLQSRPGATAGVVNNFVGGTDAEDGNAGDGQQKARNIISGNDKNGVELLGPLVNNNVILGNFIGVDRTGVAKLGNRFNGVLISEPVGGDGAPTGNFIGNDVESGGNVISGNGRDGVQISFGAGSNLVLNNIIGLDVSGSSADEDDISDNGNELGNGRHGVSIFDSPLNFIGLGTEAARNTISGNFGSGVFIGVGGDGEGATNNQVRGNYIGLDSAGECTPGLDGTCLVGNRVHGVQIDNAPDNRIGGLLQDDGNFIAGNGGNGVNIFGSEASGNKIYGNLIGLNASGLVAVPNEIDGVTIESAPDNFIGDAVIGARNVISGNVENGVQIFGANATGNRVQDNFIGTAFDGVSPLGNGKNGVFIQEAADNVIGGDESLAGNLIAFNGKEPAGGNGVAIASGTGNTIRFNEIFENFGLGIDLGLDGFTANDDQDSDVGPNQLLNSPVIVEVIHGDETRVNVRLIGAPSSQYTLDYYSDNAAAGPGLGQARKYLRSFDATTVPSGDGFVSFGFPSTEKNFSVTATDPDGNTSELGRESVIHSVEFTQAIQEWQTLTELKDSLKDEGKPPVPMIAGKPGTLRIHPNEVSTPVEVVFEFDDGGDFFFGYPIKLDPGCTPLHRRRDEMNCHSVDIDFCNPPAGTWNTELSVYKENGTLLERQEFTMQNQKAFPLVLKAVSVCATDDAGIWKCPTATEAKVKSQASKLLPQIAPTHSVSVRGTNQVISLRLAGGDVNSDGDEDDCLPSGFEADKWYHELIDVLIEEYLFNDAISAVVNGEQLYYYGLVNGAIKHIPAGAGRLGGRAAFGQDSVTRFASNHETNFETLAHEVTHNLGIPHTNIPGGIKPLAAPGCYADAEAANSKWPYCDNTIQSGPTSPNPNSCNSMGSPEVGFDVANGTPLIPESTFDIMSYCVPRWVAPFTYLGMLETLRLPSLDTRGTERGVPIGPAPFWLVSGNIINDGVHWRPLFTLETTGFDDSEEGAYRIEVRDASGAVLRERFFDPVAGGTDIGTESGDEDRVLPPFFAEVIPVEAAATLIAVMAPDNAELGALVLGGAAPEVTLAFSPGVDPVQGTQSIEWSVVDADSSEHAYRVYYSADAGETWNTLAAGLLETSVPVDFDRLSGADGSALIRVFASDGTNTGMATSAPFNVGHKLPQAEILFPENGAEFRLGRLVWLQASAFDTDDGFLDDSFVQWESDRDGDLGQGDDLPLVTLSEGTHVLTLTATDSDGNTASDSVTIEIVNTPLIENFMGPGTFEFTQSVYPADESDGAVEISVRREPGSSGAVSVDYATLADTATEGDDFESTAGTLAFADGEMEKTFLVTLVDDQVLEDDETVELTLSNPTGGAGIGANSSALILILDDDGPGTIEIVESSLDVAETDGTITIDVERRGGVRGEVSVDFSTAEALDAFPNATPDEDFASVSGTLVFTDSETLKTISVDVLDDPRGEEDEPFDLILHTPTGGASIGNDSARIHILDDEMAAASHFLVTVTSDTGLGSLRQAMLDANGNPGFDVVEFDIPGNGVRTIAPILQLPEVTDPVLIDGYSQAGAQYNTAVTGTNAILLIELDGSQLEENLQEIRFMNGIIVESDYCTVRGLVFNQFGITSGRGTTRAGIFVKNSVGCEIHGNFVGTDPTGMQARGIVGPGVIVSNCSRSRIGHRHPAGRNLISGNGSLDGLAAGKGDGISVTGGTVTSDRNRILGNLIGVASDGISPLGNLIGISLSGVRNDDPDEPPNTVVGGIEPGEGNVVAFNHLTGIRVDGVQNTYRGNSIFGNVVHGTSLGRPSASFPQDTALNDPGDLDGAGSFSPNDLQNHPHLTSITRDGDTLRIRGLLDSRPDQEYVLDFYASAQTDRSGFGSGETYLGTTTVTTGPDGMAAIDVTLPDGTEGGELITSTATSELGNTSEFSERLVVDDPLESPFVVNTTEDSDDGICDDSHCSLREAVHASNIHPGTDEIHFSIASGVQTIQLRHDLPKLTEPVIVDGTTQPGYVGAPLIELTGTTTVVNNVMNRGSASTAFRILAGPSTIRGLIMNQFLEAILIADFDGQAVFPSPDDNVIEGNYFGTNPSGTAAIPNGWAINIHNSSRNRIGSAVKGMGNLMSGWSRGVGIEVFVDTGKAAEDNVIIGNLIGTKANGMSALPLSGGINLRGADRTRIGGTAPGEGNVISGCIGFGGNGGTAVFAGPNECLVQGNIIGLGIDGVTRIGNVFGISAAGAAVIGGTEPGAGNVISGNTFGLRISSAFPGVTVQGNLIGTDISGTQSVGNTQHGIVLGSTECLIGGTEPGAGNVISGNGSNGIILYRFNIDPPSRNIIQGNFIGTQMDGVSPLGNSWDGIQLAATFDGGVIGVGPVDNVFGGLQPGAANVIAFNGQNGINVRTGTGNSILSNAIFQNQLLGIALGVDGETPNDAGDTDDGANKLQNFPSIVSAEGGDGSNLLITYTVDVTADNADIPITVQFFAADNGERQGKTLLGSDEFSVANIGQTKSAVLSLPAVQQTAIGDNIVATATDAAGNTSEFSESEETVVQPVEVDCAGVAGGDAFLDDCDVCAGGSTGRVPNADKDCKGDCFGNAFIDKCGVCRQPGDPDADDCGEPLVCPELDLVLLMDTSGSMRPNAAALCAQIDTILSQLAADGIVAHATILGIMDAPGGEFSCLSSDVVSLFGATVPGSPACCPKLMTREDWGPAIAIVAEKFPWTRGSTRAILAISDESPEGGDPCEDPGKDRAAITNAIQVSNANDVFVASLIGDGANGCVQSLAADLAKGTGGATAAIGDPVLDFADAMTSVVSAVCTGAPNFDPDHSGLQDGCPNDPSKAAPGACGCGLPETDANNNGIPDCIDVIVPAEHVEPTRTLCGAVGVAFYVVTLMGYAAMLFVGRKRRKWPQQPKCPAASAR